MPLPVFLRGDQVDLCVLDPEGDLSAYLGWVNDQATTQHMAVGTRPTSRQALRDYIAHYDGLLLGIVVRDTGAHVGNISLHAIDATNRFAEVGILIGEAGARGKGYGTEALRLLAAHAFGRMNLHKLNAGVVDGNEASRRLFEKVGFRREGILREHVYAGGRHVDALRYGLLRREFLGGTPPAPGAAPGARDRA